MKTVTLKLGNKTYTTTLLVVSEYRRAQEYLLQIARSADNPESGLAAIDGLVSIIQVAIFRADSNTTIEEISETISPGEILESTVALMRSSNSFPALNANARMN